MQYDEFWLQLLQLFKSTNASKTGAVTCLQVIVERRIQSCARAYFFALAARE